MANFIDVTYVRVQDSSSTQTPPMPDVAQMSDPAYRDAYVASIGGVQTVAPVFIETPGVLDTDQISVFCLYYNNFTKNHEPDILDITLNVGGPIRIRLSGGINALKALMGI
tara:strand:+ start:1184 stop:1516 length:333 start_codon:yes stop_codon:yes gene_type:complete